MATTSLDFPQELRQDIDFIIDKVGKDTPVQWSSLFETRTSKQESEKGLLKYGFGNAQTVSEGGFVAEDKGGEAWNVTFRHAEYGIGYTITKREQMNNLHTNTNAWYAKEARKSLIKTSEILHANVLNNAFATVLGGDGKTLCASDHPLTRPGAGTYSNLLANTQLSDTALRDMLIKIRRAVDESGAPIGLQSMRLILPPELESVGYVLLNTSMKPGTNDNDVNYVNGLGMFPKGMFLLTRLSSTTAWFIQTDASDGLVHYTRQPIQVETWKEQGTQNLKARFDEMYSMGWINSRCIYGSQGA